MEKPAQRSSRRQMGRFRYRLLRMLVRVRRTVPPGARLFLGVILIVLGIFGFLPVLGFWMIPLGIMVAALDIAPLRRWLSSKASRRLR